MTTTYKNRFKRLNYLNAKLLRKILCFGGKSGGQCRLVLRHAPKNFRFISDFPTQ